MPEQIPATTAESSQTFQPSARRVLLGFALAPLLPGFYATMFFAQPWAFPIGLAMSYPSALLFGLPLYLMGRRHGRTHWWACVIGGLISAAPAMVLYRIIGTPPHLEAFDLLNGLGVLLWGGFTGICFWLLALAGRTPLDLRSFFGVGHF